MLACSADISFDKTCHYYNYQLNMKSLVQNRDSYRILSWGGIQDGSRMIVGCKSMLTHV